jgi:hypothetical protein
MSWSELERLVEEAERDGTIRRSLRCCRSQRELLMASKRLGYRIQALDLRNAWLLEQASCKGITPADRGSPWEFRRAGDGG